MSAEDRDETASIDIVKKSNKGNSAECDDPKTRVNIALHTETHVRLTAYKNFNPLMNKTFDEAVGELLDAIEFPQPDQFESQFVPSLTLVDDLSDD